MTDFQGGRRSSQFDRVGRPRPRGHRRDATGKEALFSTAPSSVPPAPLEVTCPDCAITTGLRLPTIAGLLRPPFLLDPFRGRIWSRCPNCGQRRWLDLTPGQALRALRGRRSG